jgi:hypothetical protein
MPKIFRMPAESICSLPLPVVLTYRPLVLYSLFRKDVNTKRWIRVSDSAYDEKTAMRVFSARYLTAPLTYSIRPIRIEENKAQGISRF